MSKSSRNELNPPSTLLNNARRRCKWELVAALREGNDKIISALPAMGKSRGAIFAASETGIPITVLTGRGHEEQYQQFGKWCDEFDLTWERIPSFTNDCDTYNGKHGSKAKSKVSKLYDRGVRPAQIHKKVEPPCIDDCTYTKKWDTNLDDFDVLIGHYTHGYLTNVIQGRAVFVDEFSGNGFETKIPEPKLPRIVTSFVQAYELPFTSYKNLIETRDDTKKLDEALDWFEEYGFEISGKELIANSKLYRNAPLLVYSLLNSEKLGNGWERCSFSKFDITQQPLDFLKSYKMAFNPTDGYDSSLYLLNPPDWSYARNVIGLDGTPIMAMWGEIIPTAEKHQVLSEKERREYISEGLNHHYILTTTNTKPYSSHKSEIHNRVNVGYDAAVFDGVVYATGINPGLISTKGANKVYEENDIYTIGPNDEFNSSHIACAEHYGNLLGSNRLDTCQVGVLSGSQHFGDNFIEKWGAYHSHAVERERQGVDITYGPLGDEIYQHMVRNQTLQAAMRFGRESNDPTVVFVNTNTLPEWVPVVDQVKAVRISEGLRSVADAIRGVDEWQTTEDVSNHPQVDVGISMVRKHLQRLHEMGLIERKNEGRGKVVRDEKLERLPEYGYLTHVNDSDNQPYTISYRDHYRKE